MDVGQVVFHLAMAIGRGSPSGIISFRAVCDDIISNKLLEGAVELVLWDFRGI